MAFTADKVLEYYESQYGKKGGAEYFADFGLSDLGSWCAIGACDALKHAGKNIGAWINCGTDSGSGIQAGFKKANFNRCDNLKEAARGAFLIMNWHNDTYYIYDHVCCWYGDYDSTGKKVRTANFNVSGTNAERYFNISDIQAIWMPDYVDGWIREYGKWRHYTNGELDKNCWVMGSGSYAGKWFYLGNNGNVLTDEWIKTNGKYYYVGSDGAAVTKKIMKHHDKYYYLGSDGAVKCAGTITLKCNEDGSLSLE